MQLQSAPATTVDELGVAPDSASNFCSNCVTLSVTLIWLLPAAPEATKVMFWPFTVMVSPAANAALSALLEVGRTRQHRRAGDGRGTAGGVRATVSLAAR